MSNVYIPISLRSRLSLPETFQAIMKKTTSEVRWRKANITKADFLKKVVKKTFKWTDFSPLIPFIFLRGLRQKFAKSNCNSNNLD